MIFLLQMLCTIYIIDRRAGNCGEIELGRPANQAAARLGSTHHHHHRHYHHQQYYDHHCVFGIWEQVFFSHMFGIWVSMIVSMGLFRGIKGCAFNIIGTQHGLLFGRVFGIAGTRHQALFFWLVGMSVVLQKLFLYLGSGMKLSRPEGATRKGRVSQILLVNVLAVYY